MENDPVSTPRNEAVPTLKKFHVRWEQQPSHSNVFDPTELAIVAGGKVWWDTEPVEKQAGWENREGTIELPDTDEAKEKVAKKLLGIRFGGSGNYVDPPDHSLFEWAGLEAIEHGAGEKHNYYEIERKDPKRNLMYRAPKGSVL